MPNEDDSSKKRTTDSATKISTLASRQRLHAITEELAKLEANSPEANKLIAEHRELTALLCNLLGGFH